VIFLEPYWKKSSDIGITPVSPGLPESPEPGISPHSPFLRRKTPAHHIAGSPISHPVDTAATAQNVRHRIDIPEIPPIRGNGG